MAKFRQHIILLLLVLNCPLFTKADTVDNYQILIKKRLVLNESGYGSAIKKVNLLVLKCENSNDSLNVFFNHCTQGSTKRRIKLIDSTQKVVFEWAFSDEHDERSMSIAIKQIWQYSNTPFLSLYYYDDHVLNGSFLTLVAFEDKNLATVIATYRKKFKNY